MKTLKETVIVCLFMLMVSMNVMAINDQHGRDLNDKKAAG